MDITFGPDAAPPELPKQSFDLLIAGVWPDSQDKIDEQRTKILNFA
jgi:hypothetical protein